MSDEVSRPTPTGAPNMIDNTERLAQYDPVVGTHLWTWVVLYRAVPGNWDPILDHENLLITTGPCCHYCGCHQGDPAANNRCDGRPAAGRRR